VFRFEGVSKIYSTDVVLKNISWEIKKGEKVGLVGSNGAGKSTQFKILIGEEEQTSGTIIKEGNPKIAHLKQEFDCNLNFSVRQELESSFKEIQIVAIKLLEIENKMKSLDIKKNSYWSIGTASKKEIEKINILNASLLAMKRSILKLKFMS